MTIEANVRWVKDLQFVGWAIDSSGVVIDSTKGGRGTTPMKMLLDAEKGNSKERRKG